MAILNANYIASRLQDAFPVLYTELVEPGIVPFATLLNALCVNPRRLFRLPGGKIEAGEIADLTVLDLNWPHAIDSSLFFSQGRSTPFDGWTVTAGVDKTICNGNLVYTASSRNINQDPHPPLSGGLPMKQSLFTMEHARQLTADTYELVLSGDTSAITAPGQFVNIQLPGNSSGGLSPSATGRGRPAAPGPGGGRRHP